MCFTSKLGTGFQQNRELTDFDETARNLISITRHPCHYLILSTCFS
jgi:hypothetical protein